MAKDGLQGFETSFCEVCKTWVQRESSGQCCENVLTWKSKHWFSNRQKIDTSVELNRITGAGSHVLNCVEMFKLQGVNESADTECGNIYMRFRDLLCVHLNLSGGTEVFTKWPIIWSLQSWFARSSYNWSCHSLHLTLTVYETMDHGKQGKVEVWADYSVLSIILVIQHSLC